MDVDRDFAAFVDARGAGLYRLACLLTGSPGDAEDLLQDSLEKVYLRWASVTAAQAPYPYVRRLMVNTLVSRRRRVATRREVLRPDPPERTVEFPERLVLEHAALWPHVRALPPRQRAVVVLRYYEDLTEQQIADVLGCSTGTVKSQAHDAIAALRRAVDVAAGGEVVTGP